MKMLNKKLNFIERFDNFNIYKMSDNTYSAYKIMADQPTFNYYNDIERLKASIEQYNTMYVNELKHR